MKYEVIAKNHDGWKVAAKILADMMLMILMSLVILFVFENNGSIQAIWMRMQGLLMCASLLLVVWGHCVAGTGAIARRVALLLQIGMALQLRLLYPEEHLEAGGEAMKLACTVLFCVFAGLLLGSVLGRLTRRLDEKKSVQWMNLAMTAVYVLLLLVGRRYHAGSVYLSVGETVISGTMFAVIPALMSLGMTFSDEGRSAQERLLSGLFILAVSAGFFLMAGDVGTLAVLCIICVALGAVYLPRREAVTLAGLLAGAGITAVLVCYGCSCLYDARDGMVPGLVRFGNRAFRALCERVDVFFDPEGKWYGYQVQRMMHALKEAEIIGSAGEQMRIPMEKSDAAFAALIARMGLAFGLLVLVLTVGLFKHMVRISADAPVRVSGGVGMAFAMYIVTTSLFSALCNTGLLPMVGLPFAFISKSGSAMMVALMMCGYLMSLAGENRGEMKDAHAVTCGNVLWAVCAVAAVMIVVRIMFAMIIG